MQDMLIGLIAMIATAANAWPGGSRGEVAVSEMKPSDIEVRINVRQAGGREKKHVLVDFEFKNHSRVKKRLEKWLALDPPVVTDALLQVKKVDGSPIKYIGRHYNRSGATKDEYLSLAPGQSRIVRDVDVTAVYDWPPDAQKLMISYEAFSFGQKIMEVVQSPTHELDYVPIEK